MNDDFGIIIGCCKQDLRYALGCYASIRYFMPDGKVCFLYDGPQAPESLKSLPGVRTLDRSTVRSEILRERSFGPGITKMIAFFESPFERFLFLDADTVVVGDPRRITGWDDHDILTDRGGHYEDEAIDRWFFDTSRIASVVPSFDYGSHRDDYFCTGTFFARRGSLSLDRYLEMLDLNSMHPGLFKFWEMGFLNLMIFEAKDAKTARVDGISYQRVVRDHDAKDLQDFFVQALKDPEGTGTPLVYHFPNPKQFVYQSSVYSEPMTFFRRRFRQQYRNLGWLRSEMQLLQEDLKYVHYPRWRFLFRSKTSSLLRRIGLRK